MTWSYGERLYQSLPAILRVRDVEQGEPLRALLSVIESELELVEADIEGLYEDWFIETSGEWVVPYIGDLLGVHPLRTVDEAGVYSLRAYVANTLRYRRRKGTASVLEQLARDVTGWPARAVEFFQLLGTTQHHNHIRLANHRTPDLRDSAQLEMLNGPFDTAAHSGEVRHIKNRRGKYNIPNIGLFLWRLGSYQVSRGRALPVSGGAPGRFTFDPLGMDVPLFNIPETETEITHLAEEVNVPGPLRRRPLFDELEAFRDALESGGNTVARYFNSSPVFEVHKPIGGQSYPPESVLICDLSAWDAPGWQPRSSVNVTMPGGGSFDTLLAVDPVLGRLVFLDGAPAPAQVDVSYACGFSADIGAGPYDKEGSVRAELPAGPDWLGAVSKWFPAEDPAAGKFKSLTRAVQEWNGLAAGSKGIIVLLDSATYTEHLDGSDKIEVPARSSLSIVAGDWPTLDLPVLPEALQKAETRLVRPHLKGNIHIRGTAPEKETPGSLLFHGLLIEGDIRVLNGNLGGLVLAHSTLVPGRGEIRVTSSVSTPAKNQRLCLALKRSISGPVIMDEPVEEITVADSIVDGQGASALLCRGAFADISRSTVLGRSFVRWLQASETIFTLPVIAARRQRGCTRFSFVPAGSRTPRRYRCQPDLALLEKARALGLEGVEALPAQAAARILSRLKPAFTSERFGDPGYAQLADRCPDTIRTGAADGAEMGAFNLLKQAQRVANLKAALDEYLRFGLEAGVFNIS